MKTGRFTTYGKFVVLFQPNTRIPTRGATIRNEPRRLGRHPSADTAGGDRVRDTETRAGSADARAATGIPAPVVHAATGVPEPEGRVVPVPGAGAVRLRARHSVAGRRFRAARVRARHTAVGPARQSPDAVHGERIDRGTGRTARGRPDDVSGHRHYAGTGPAQRRGHVDDGDDGRRHGRERRRRGPRRVAATARGQENATGV